ncbi:MAG: hypothetical protein V7603_1494 [Micromonosporaceae bacterium]
MRMLLVTMPTLSHFHHLVPVATAARALGHEVTFASSDRFVPTIARYGFDAVGYRPHPDPEAPPRGVANLRSSESLSFPEPSVCYMLGQRPLSAVHRLTALITHTRVHLVVRDSTELIAALAADRVGVPHAAVTTSPLSVLPAQRALLAEMMAAVRQRMRGPYTRTDDLAIGDDLPPVVYAAWGPRPRTIVPFAHSTVVRPAEVVPAWLGALPPRPTIYIAFGTTVEAGTARLLRILRAIASQPVRTNVIVAGGRSATDVLRGLARRYLPDVVIEPFLPQRAILRTASLMVTHGGITSVKEALAAGVPMVFVPTVNDTSVIAERCAQLGLGVRVAGTSSSAELARAIAHVLDSDSIRRMVRAFRDEMASMPPVDHFVERLAQLVPTGDRRRRRNLRHVGTGAGCLG